MFDGDDRDAVVDDPGGGSGDRRAGAQTTRPWGRGGDEEGRDETDNRRSESQEARRITTVETAARAASEPNPLSVVDGRLGLV